MNVQNYYVIRRHPEGGYAIVQGFTLDGGFPLDLEMKSDLPRYGKLSEARSEAASLYSEYGTLVHPECEIPPK